MTWGFDIINQTWSVLRPQGYIPDGRFGASCDVVDGHLVVYGGHLPSDGVLWATGESSDNVIVLHGETAEDLRWTRLDVNSGPAGRYLHSSAPLLFNGVTEILILGGLSMGPVPVGDWKQQEIFMESFTGTNESESVTTSLLWDTWSLKLDFTNFTGTWTRRALNSTIPRVAMPCAAFEQTNVVCVGGFSSFDSFFQEHPDYATLIYPVTFDEWIDLNISATRSPQPLYNGMMQPAWDASHGESLFLFGGTNWNGPQSSMYRISSVQNQFQYCNGVPQLYWDQIHPLSSPWPRAETGGVELDGQLYIFGGRVELEFLPLNDLWRFDTGTSEWRLLFPLTKQDAALGPPGRVGMAVALGVHQGSDMLLVYGGQTTDQPGFTIFGDIWAWNISSNSALAWLKLDSNCTEAGVCMPKPRVAAAYTMIGEYQLVISGGWYGNRTFGTGWDGFTYNDTWIFDMNSLTWSQLVSNNEAPSGRLYANLVHLRNKLYRFGGGVWREKNPLLGPSNVALINTLYAFDLETKLWSVIPTSGQVPPAM